MAKWRCTVCGKEFEGDAPPVPCPVCGAGAAAFEQVRLPATARWRCTVCAQIFTGDAPPVPCPVCGAGQAAFELLEEAESAFVRDTKDKFVIIGGGLAGLEAAKAIRKRNRTAAITMVTAEHHCPYNRPALARVVADGASLASLLLEPEEFYPQNNVTLAKDTIATAINPAAHTVALSTGQALPYTKLLLATGATPFNPIRHTHGSVPVKVLRSFEDAMDLVGYARGRRVLLVGGGILGLEAAIALRERGATVTVVEFAPRILPLQTDEAASAMLAGRLQALGIALHTGLSVTEATEGGVVLSNGATMAADLVLASMGVRSEVSLALAIGLNLGRGIVVDEYMRTSHADIFAAGDCAEFEGRVQAIAGAASGMGAVAGAAMAGDTGAPYRPFVPATAYEVPGFSLFSCGVVSEEPAQEIVARDALRGSYKRLFFNGGALTGALFVGENPGAAALRALAEGAPPAKAVQLLV
ncbi:FAD-dependent oxidoreductase [Ruminococcaceae bacterium OttesenSCG-928-O06]|nr:FAD-dependent oxidoreductase [Ruminococcaceae bacterium OttesenSCG-928-O06]